jgi:hypothetical protein
LKNLKLAACLTWVQERDIVQINRGKLRFSTGSENCVKFEFPKKPSEVIPLALMITGVGTEYESTYVGSLFWITDFGIWSDDSERIARVLFASLRGTGVGEDNLEMWPGTKFEQSELDPQRAAIQVSLTIGWDAYYFPIGKDHFVFMSHDEFIEVYCRTKVALDHWKQIKAVWH